MNDNYKILTTFEYSTEAHVTKSRLDSEEFETMLMDEKIIDSDPMISNAIGGVKLLVHKNDFEKAVEIYNEIRASQKDKIENNFFCPKCNSNRILIAPIQRKNVFYMLFLFFKKQDTFVTVVRKPFNKTFYHLTIKENKETSKMLRLLSVFVIQILRKISLSIR